MREWLGINELISEAKYSTLLNKNLYMLKEENTWVYTIIPKLHDSET